MPPVLDNCTMRLHICAHSHAVLTNPECLQPVTECTFNALWIRGHEIIINTLCPSKEVFFIHLHITELVDALQAEMPRHTLTM